MSELKKVMIENSICQEWINKAVEEERAKRLKDIQDMIEFLVLMEDKIVYFENEYVHEKINEKSDELREKIIKLKQARECEK